MSNKSKINAFFIWALLLISSFATADNQSAIKQIYIDNAVYQLMPPKENPTKLVENTAKLERLLAEQKQISQIIQSTKDKVVLEQQFDLIQNLMQQQDMILKDIFQQGIYSKPFLVKFIAFRKSFSRILAKDFAKFVQQGIADAKAARRFLTMFDVNSSEYESAFMYMLDNYVN